LPGREDKDAGEVVVVPGELLLGEEAADVVFHGRGAVGTTDGGDGFGVDEEEVVEACDVEEDGFVVEE